MIKKYPAWLNGNYCNIEDLKISVLDLGLIHCDATYEVINSKNRKTQARLFLRKNNQILRE